MLVVKLQVNYLWTRHLVSSPLSYTIMRYGIVETPKGFIPSKSAGRVLQPTLTMLKVRQLIKRTLLKISSLKQNKIFVYFNNKFDWKKILHLFILFCHGNMHVFIDRRFLKMHSLLCYSFLAANAS